MEIDEHDELQQQQDYNEVSEHTAISSSYDDMKIATNEDEEVQQPEEHEQYERMEREHREG